MTSIIISKNTTPRSSILWNLKEFQVSIGHVDFIQSLFEATNLEDEQKEEIRTLIANRNFFGVEEILDHYEIDDQVKKVRTQFPVKKDRRDALYRQFYEI